MLSAAKHLTAQRDKPFAALRVTTSGTLAPRHSAAARQHCHAERSEASRCRSRETLRCAQSDNMYTAYFRNLHCPARQTLRCAQGDTKASSLVAIEKCRNP